MPRNHYERWTEEELHSLMFMRSKGKTDKEIAEVLGRSTSGVTNAVHRERKRMTAELESVIIQAVEKPQPTFLERTKRWLGISR